MKLVIAHQGDRIARDLVTALGSGAHLVTPRSLSAAGWTHYPTGGGDDVIVVDGERARASALAGVVTRIGAVSVSDLTHIVESDRMYVAAEMTAFLLSFLSALSCPVINPPTPGCLMGPGWTQARWRAAAARAGFAACRFEQAGGHEVIIVGQRCFGAPSERCESAARALAAGANLELIGLRVEDTVAGPILLAVDPWCALHRDAVIALEQRIDGSYT